MLSLPASARRFASNSCPLVILFFLPPLRPLALAAASPAIVRSRMISRSSSAIEAVIRKKNLPIAEAASICSFRLLSSTPLFSKFSASSIKCLVKRLARSSFQICGSTQAQRPIHVQCSYPSRLLIKIVTVYEPNPKHWNNDFTQRKRSDNDK